MNIKIAIVGRQNVGKSTLFNTLTSGKQALISSSAGMTRDRLYGEFFIGDNKFKLIDTPGISSAETLPGLWAQIDIALREASLIYLVLDGKHGIHPLELELKQKFYKLGKPVIAIINKMDLLSEQDILSRGFYELRMERLVAVSALHKTGIAQLKLLSQELLKCQTDLDEEDPEKAIRCAIIGKPNVGKSTLINSWLGHKRQMVYDQPGTTTDSVEIPFKHEGQQYILIDTAGVRRRSKMPDSDIDRLATVRTLTTIDKADIVILLIDGTQDLSQQDLRLLRLCFVVKKKPMVIAVNKCDLQQAHVFKKSIRDRLAISFSALAQSTKINFISARTGTGVSSLLRIVREIYQKNHSLPTTHQLNVFLQQCITKLPCLTKNHLPIKMKYVHVIDNNPITLAIYGNRLNAVSLTYRRYLENCFRNFLKLSHMPLKLIFKESFNKYQGV